MGINDLDLNLLKAFIAVAEEKHFTKAAKSLFVEQSAISKSIKRLELELGTQLFLRTNRKVELTTKGENLYLRAKEIIQLTSDFVSYAHDTEQELSGTLKFGAESPISFLYIPNVLEKLAKEYPKLWPMMFTETTSNLANKIKNREIEFAFMFYEAERLKELEYREIKKVEFQLVISPKTSKHAKDSFIGSREINHQSAHLPTFEKLRRKNKNLFIKYSANDIMAYKELILKGLGIGLLPKEFVKEEIKDKRLKKIYPELKLSFPIYLVQHGSYPLTMEAQKLIELISASI
ncbi:MAG: hypothetical protein CMJ16_06120 [Peredibacter sp.]|nr:hypothetical protein [Peredibacter sp.]